MTAAGAAVAVLALWTLWSGCKVTPRVRPFMTTPADKPQVIALDRGCRIRVGIATGEDNIELLTNAPARLRAGSIELDLDEGCLLRFEPAETVPADCVYHVIVGTVRGGDASAAEPKVQEWHDRGYRVELLGRGAVFRGENGLELDGRSILVSAARFATEREAGDAQRVIEQQGLDSWVEREIVERARGTVLVTVIPADENDGVEDYVFDAPIELESSAPIVAVAIDYGFWGSKVQDAAFGGTLEVGLDPAGMLELVEQTTVEEYLRGVVPAEMPASWPQAALEVQAVCARSEVFSQFGVRHMGEDFDLCATEHCQAYRGASWHARTTDEAVRRTAGVVLVSDDRLLHAVYSLNCGGHTEDNDAVWAAPPDVALRGVPDAEPRALDGMSLKNETDLRRWLLQETPAYCSHVKPDGRKNFRWRVRYSAQEVDELVAKQYPEVGRIRDIRLVERGVSGRLKRIDIVGRGATVTVLKELPIRRLFGGLYSAAFVLDIKRAEDGMPASFEFIGGGRGHGVGMCQAGCRYLASSGREYEDILRHYYRNADIVRLYD